MEVHSSFHHSPHPYQPRFYDHPYSYPRMQSPYARPTAAPSAPPPPPAYHRRAPSSDSANHHHHHSRTSSSPRQPDHTSIKLPSISDILNFSRDSDRHSHGMLARPDDRPRADADFPPPTASMQRPEPHWPRSSAPAPAPAPALKVETSNIDPRLQRAVSPPLPASALGETRASPRPYPAHSPAYSLSAGPAPSSYPSSAYSDARSASVVSSAESKRLSLHSAPSSRSSHSVGYPSPETAKSAISMYPPVPPRRVSLGGMAHQRPLPTDFPGVPTSNAPAPTPHPHPHSHSTSSMPEPSYAYHASPTASHAASHPPATPVVTTTAVAATPTSGPASTQLQDRYVCGSCNKAFSRPSSLRIHSHSHTGEKPFKCTRKGCGKAFSVRSNMKRHERGCHVDGSGPRSLSPRSMDGDA